MTKARRTSAPSACLWCGRPLQRGGVGRPAKFCVRGHRQRYHHWRQITGRPISLVLLAEQSGQRCGICTGPVDLLESGQLGPSIDHVLPTARGGSNELDNLQLAHQACNLLKRDRAGFTCPPVGSELRRPLTLF